MADVGDNLAISILVLNYQLNTVLHKSTFNKIFGKFKKKQTKDPNNYQFVVDCKKKKKENNNNYNNNKSLSITLTHPLNICSMTSSALTLL